MCKATCQNKCQPGAHFKDCGKTINVFHAERSAQHTPAVKIPVGLGGSAQAATVDPDDASAWSRLQAAHLESAKQSLMHEACAIASALAAESAMDSDQEPLKALMRHAGTQEGATAHLLKLVGRVGLRNWFDGDFVVLSQEEARRVAAAIDPAGFGRGVLDALEHKIRTACQ